MNSEPPSTSCISRESCPHEASSRFAGSAAVGSSRRLMTRAPLSATRSHNAGDGCSMKTCTSRPTASARSTLRCPAGSRVSPKSDNRAGRSTSPGSSRNRAHAPSTRSAGSGTPIRARSRRQSSACQTPSTGSARPSPSPSSPRAQARTISGRCSAYRSNSSARCRTVLNRRARRAGSAASPPPPRCAAKLRSHGSPRHPSTTSSKAQTARSGNHGSASASIPDAVATASPTSLRGDGKSTFAHTPSPRPSPAPSRSDIRCASHRSMPRVGTATTSGANGSGNGVGQQRAKRLDQSVGPLSSMDMKHVGESAWARTYDRADAGG